MAANVVLADKLVELGFGEHFEYLVVNAREHDMYIFLQALLTEIVKVVHTGGVDERYLTHADDAHGGVATHVVHHLLEAVGDTEEVRAVDLVYLYAVRDGEVLRVVREVAAGTEVYLARRSNSLFSFMP